MNIKSSTKPFLDRDSPAVHVRDLPWKHVACYSDSQRTGKKVESTLTATSPAWGEKVSGQWRDSRVHDFQAWGKRRRDSSGSFMMAAVTRMASSLATSTVAIYARDIYGNTGTRKETVRGIFDFVLYFALIIHFLLLF